MKNVIFIYHNQTIVEKLKGLRAQRFKPKFEEEENKIFDLQIDDIITDLTNVS